MTNPHEVAAGLRKIAQGLNHLADALLDDVEPAGGRERAALLEWGERGLTREQASALLRKHGFAPQTAGGWSRGDGIEIRDDGRRYLTARSLDWLAEPEATERD